MTIEMEAVVSPDWLETRLLVAGGGVAAPEEAGQEAAPPPGVLVIADLREPHLYAAGHIPGSISTPFSPMSDWAVSDDELMLELPPAEDLFAALGAWGIGPDSQVVLVTTVEPPSAPPYALADAPRAAATLHYAGVTAVAVLDGGFPRWAAEGRPVSAEPAAPHARPWTGPVASGMFVSTEYVKERLGKAVLVDGRNADEYFGVSACPFAGVGGHIAAARSLPVPWFWEPGGSYKPGETLRAMAEGVLGADRDQEVIVYCGVGGFAAVLWFVLTRMLGYRDVKIYDASAEAWVKTEAMVSFTW